MVSKKISLIPIPLMQLEDYIQVRPLPNTLATIINTQGEMGLPYLKPHEILKQTWALPLIIIEKVGFLMRDEIH